MQEQLDHIIGGTLLTLVFAAFDEYWPEDPRSLNTTGSDLVEGRDLDWLLAMRHARHSFVHRLDSRRADGLADVFDRVIEGSAPLLGVQRCDNETIVLKQSIGRDALIHLKAITEKVLNDVSEARGPTEHHDTN